MAGKGADIQTRRKIAKRYLAGEAANALMAERKISKSTLFRWIRELRTAQKETARNEKDQPITRRMYNRLKEHADHLENTIAFLKSVHCTAGDPLAVKLAEMERMYYEKDYSVHLMCDALDVSRGTFYNFIKRNKRENSSYAKRREELRVLIRDIFDESNQIYGAPKVFAELKDRGERTSLATVRLLMREMGLASIRYGSKKMYRDETRKCQNLVKQNFNVSAPNKVWVSDVTYYKSKGEEYYICSIIDLYARKVVGWKIGYHNNTNLIKATFKAAYAARQPGADLIFHSDRGSNYRSRTFSRYLGKCGVTQSFSKAGTPYDNSVMESFFSSLKREELYRTRYRSEREFRAAVARYMSFYNDARRHSSIGNNTPKRYEEKYAEATSLDQVVA